MKEIIINVTEDAVELVQELVERIGGTVESNKNKTKLKSNAKATGLKPLDFFGTWTDIPLDPEIYRKKLRRKTPVEN